MKRVLIVDDELPILSGLSKALHELCNFHGEVRTVVNGREAVNETGCCFYDVCFLDIKLPDINGFDVMRDINRLSPSTSIVLMSGSYLRGDLTDVLESGEAYYIEKPFRFEQIKHIMDLALKKDNKEMEPMIPVMDGKRRHKRRPMAKIIGFRLDGSDSMDFKGGVTDISYSGVGLETYYPVEKGQMISLISGLGNKIGTVVWSYNRSEYNYRAGIKFI